MRLSYTQSLYTKLLGVLARMAKKKLTKIRSTVQRYEILQKLLNRSTQPSLNDLMIH